MGELREELSMLWHHGVFPLRTVLVFGLVTFNAGMIAGALILLTTLCSR